MLVGAVLAGGASRRMGRPKALVAVDGVPMARRVADAMEAAGVAGGSVVLVGGDERWAGSLGLRWAPDRWPGEGPLGGLATALLDAPGVAGVAPDAAGAAPVIVLVAACDQPWVTGTALHRLVEALAATCGADLAAAVAAGRRQPHPAAWRASCGADLEALVEGGARRADAAWSGREVVDVDLPPDVVADVDGPGDLPPRP